MPSDRANTGTNESKPSADDKLDQLVERVLRREPRAVARAMRYIDDRDPRFVALLKKLYPHTGGAYVLGITGTPGAGKSTLVDRLIEAYRREGKTVGVIAVDPTSPYTGGALLGDRIRMQRHFGDEGVFIRSLATRGHMGGLSRSTGDISRVLDAAGYDVVICETVGVGQDELEVARLAHTTVVVMAPGLGDEIQAIKAGILEVADVFAVNKADREGVEATVRDLEQMIALGDELSGKGRHALAGHGHSAAAAGRREAKRAAREREGQQGEAWTPPVLKTVASRGEGIDALSEAAAAHGRYLFETEAGARLRAQRLGQEFVGIFQQALLAQVQHRFADALERAEARVGARETDPYSEAERLVAAALGGPVLPPSSG
jgi:LAO/AO transport system kinase